ncbi:FAD-dependent oxidoreductase [Halorubrum lacusprofundi]|jgi:thioredoxin reductase|uniref:Thioredoxin reductase-like protein n=1 Tax=Halorubrum lacusprofundi (strain ATCC 49239 / DSM 5036 / JCM 8891 / ACAM 34) TaxID=416348 RepID=B9LTL0_HALLT|nr:FAD-dependent oxidoreductase [Halorubrum lacusprofundi]ACM56144.1 thioredoxin reductase-like protein [Halorubrum lacusprofundi ATCC 49239]MCG1005545.1 FAD-dependent oxidoreductase [Halorubrum lacusprofundi]
MSGDRTPSDSERDSHDFRDVVVVGGGVAGLSTAVFTARQGLDTLVIDDGGSLLRRNAHLENFPGFPLGVDARRLLDLLAEQAATAGADRFDGRATRVAAVGEGESVETGGDEAVDDARFVVEVDGDDADDPSDPSDPTRTRHVVAATKNEVGYLEGVEGVGILDRGKSYVDTDERGRTGVDGLYAAGRLAEKPHQAAVCAGHGAEVGVTILEEDERGFYHDWVAPEGYFTDRGRQVPPGCEEIDAAERREREEASREAIRERFAAPHPDPQETHPSLEE